MEEPQGQMTVMVLIKLLERNRRLPCPKDCPPEVLLHAIELTLCWLNERPDIFIMSFFFFFNKQVKMLMEQCWAADPRQRPTFRSLIEKFEGIRRTFDFHSNINFSLAQIC